MLLKYSRSLIVSSVSILVLAGFLMLLSHSMAQENPVNWMSRLLFKQLFALLLGMAGLYVTSKISLEFIGRNVLWIYLGTVVLLVATLVLGVTAGGSSRWLSIGGLTFQPSEIAKLSIVFFSSYFLVRFKERFHSLRPLMLYLSLVLVVIALVLLAPDLGGAFSIAMIVFVMLWVSRVPKVYLLAIVLAIAPLVVYVAAMEEYRLERMAAFLDPWADPSGSGYQNIQSYVALATGGIWGRGFTNSIQKFFYLPESNTDFVFAILGEEFGMIGTTIVLLAFAVLFFTGMALAMRSSNEFHALLIVGSTSVVCVPALINICVVVGLLPITGMPLTFVSYGGSSLVVSLFAIGLLLNLEERERKAMQFLIR